MLPLSSLVTVTRLPSNLFIKVLFMNYFLTQGGGRRGWAKRWQMMTDDRKLLVRGKLLRLLQCFISCRVRKPIKGESNGIRCGRPTTRGEERGTVPLSTEVVSVGGGLQPNPPTTQPPSCHPSNTQFFCSQRVARWVHAFFLSCLFEMYKNKKLVLSHCKDLGSNKISYDSLSISFFAFADFFPREPKEYCLILH